MTARTYLLGLTGSIGMGKSTTAGLFGEAGVPVWDADAAVGRLYGPGGAGRDALADLVPAATEGDHVDREALRATVLVNPGLLDRVEARVHPLIALDRERFMRKNARDGLLVFDVPLLFETATDGWMDGVLVVTAPSNVQRARVLARPGMSVEVLEKILARQTPDAEKRARADFVIETGGGIEAARRDVLSLIARINSEAGHA